MELIDKYNLKELKRIILFKKYKKILIVAGYSSYFSSKAKVLIDKLTKEKITNLFLKKKNSRVSGAYFSY